MLNGVAYGKTQGVLPPLLTEPLIADQRLRENPILASIHAHSSSSTTHLAYIHK